MKISNSDKIKALEEEIQELKKKNIDSRNKNIGYFLYGIRTFFLGPSLNSSVYDLQDQLLEGSVQKETSADVIAGVIKRLTWIGIVALVPICILLFQTYQLSTQNSLFSRQNEEIHSQNILLESSRRSSYILLLSDLFERISTDIQLSESNKLTKSTLRLICSTSKMFRPYRYSDPLNNDTLITNPLSPERGHLLMHLLSLDLDSDQYKYIFRFGDFTYSDLRDVNLSESNLYSINLNYSDFTSANLTDVLLQEAQLSSVNFYDANISRLQILNSQFHNSNFIGARIEYDDFVCLKSEMSNPILSEPTKAKDQYSMVFELTKYGIIQSLGISQYPISYPIYDTSYNYEIVHLHKLGYQNQQLILENTYWNDF
jgi:hypothetical protein